MNPDLKTQWLAALRSGEYEQGFGALEKDGKYCCLGVLNKLANLGGYDAKTAAPENASTEALRLFGYNPIYVKAGVMPSQGRTLILMNDDKRNSFEEIANYVEHHL